MAYKPAGFDCLYCHCSRWFWFSYGFYVQISNCVNDSLLQFLFDEAERRPLTVSELNAELRGAVEQQFANVWVEGEVVGFLQASSGHWYFNLNDGTSQIKCVCWKGTNYRIRFKPQNGITVRVRGRLTLWEAKGDLQLSVQSLEPSGAGALAAAYEQIRAKLEAEGLFDRSVKRQIPFFPRRIAVITSPNGAAYHDIHTVLTRRARSVDILLIPALVQGEEAADSIRKAIERANAYNLKLNPAEKIDVMIVGRGGGSAEDLWAFNDEMLARAIRASEIAVISAVGHEIDTTIADLVADIRAATPSAAAEIVAGCEEDILLDLKATENALSSLIEYKVLDHSTRLSASTARLQNGFRNVLQRTNLRFVNASMRLTIDKLKAKTAGIANSLALLEARHLAAGSNALGNRAELLKLTMAKLDALSPLAVLTRGYSITQTMDGAILRNAVNTKPGERLKIRLEHGKLDAEVLASD